MNPFAPFDALARAWWHPEAWAQVDFLEPARIDLLIGYAIDAKFACGWWEVRRSSIHDEVTGRLRRVTRIDVDGRVATIFGGEIALPDWRDGAAKSLRKYAFDLAKLPAFRTFLERDTGYRELHSVEECIDASRIFRGDSPGSRALLTIIDSPIWLKPINEPLTLNFEGSSA